MAAMVAPANDQQDPRLALPAVFEAKLRVLRELKDLLGVRREVGEEIAALLAERDRDFTRRERALIEDILARGEAGGDFREIRPRAATAAAIQAMCQALSVAEVYEDGSSAPRLIDAVFDLVLRGLEVRP